MSRFTLLGLAAVVPLLLVGGNSATVAAYGILLVLFAAYVFYIVFVSMVYYVAGGQLGDFEGDVGG